MTWLDAIRAAANLLPPDHRMVITVSPHPEVPLLTDEGLLNPAWIPPQELFVLAGEAQGSVDTTPPPPYVPPPDTERMKVVQALNVRSTPDTTKPATDKLAKGQIIEVRGAKKVGDYTWAELVTVNGVKQAGYVAREFLVKA